MVNVQILVRRGGFFLGYEVPLDEDEVRGGVHQALLVHRHALPSINLGESPGDKRVGCLGNTVTAAYSSGVVTVGEGTEGPV